MSDTADKIAKILEDPESIKMISEIAESFMSQGTTNESTEKDNTDNIGDTDETTKNDASENKVSKNAPAISGELTSSMKLLYDIIGKGDIENSIRLITALKPYMSKHRRENADSVIKWLGALKFISKYNISEISKLLNFM